MGLKDDLEKEVATIFRDKWEERDGEVVPEDKDIRLGNDAVKLDATVLYADLADSTKLVDGYKPAFAAEIYKTFLHCAAKIIRSHGGVITAYDGDRIMAVYIGTSKNTSAPPLAFGKGAPKEGFGSPASRSPQKSSGRNFADPCLCYPRSRRRPEVQQQKLCTSKPTKETKHDYRKNPHQGEHKNPGEAGESDGQGAGDTMKLRGPNRVRFASTNLRWFCEE